MRDEIETKRRLLTRALYLEIVSPTAANKRKADRIAAQLSGGFSWGEIRECLEKALVMAASDEHYGRQ